MDLAFQLIVFPEKLVFFVLEIFNFVLEMADNFKVIERFFVVALAVVNLGNLRPIAIFYRLLFQPVCVFALFYGLRSLSFRNNICRKRSAVFYNFGYILKALLFYWRRHSLLFGDLRVG